MKQHNDFTQGKILGPLLRFTVPVLLAMCLQSTYGAVDMWVVARFATPMDVSGVSTGSQIMITVTSLISGLATGVTVLLGQYLGMKRREEAGDILGSSLCFFGLLSAGMTALLLLFARQAVNVMQTPAEAYTQTLQYVRICGGGTVFIIAYNLLGGVFRGLGDSKTPLYTVLAACLINIAADVLFVAVLQWGAAGAAAATVLAQALSVVFCCAVIGRRGLPFAFGRANLRLRRDLVGQVLRLGFPIALQDALVCISFLVIIAIVNTLGVIASAGVGVAEKITGFIMLAPSAFARSLSSFVAQNIGARQPERARKAMLCGMGAAFAMGAVLAYFAFFRGDVLSRLFSADEAVVAASADYLKSYAIDTLQVAFLFCFTGYFNGCGCTMFVMAQGIVGAFLVRIPMAFLFSSFEPVSVFRVGLATPASTLVQIVLCIFYYRHQKKKEQHMLPAAPV